VTGEGEPLSSVPQLGWNACLRRHCPHTWGV